MNEMLRDILYKKTAKPVAALDSAVDKEVKKDEKPAEKEGKAGDKEAPVLDSAEAYAEADIALAATAAVQQWVETDDLDEGEGYADRLLAMMVGVADANKDGEITEDEQEIVDVALNAAWDYLVKFGVTDEDAGSLLNDWDEDAAVRVRDLVAASLPEGEGAADADIDAFVFGEEGEASTFDSVTLDAAYKKVVAIRRGKKVRIKKRVSGHVRLSAKQKMSIRKARMKSHSAGATMRRMKSMRMRRKAGL